MPQNNVSGIIAFRYLFRRRSSNAIHLITGIGVVGLAICTAAMVLVLSVFNGFEELLTQMNTPFNADVTILPTHGKTFIANDSIKDILRQVDGIQNYSLTLEETSFFEYMNQQSFGIIKGVDLLYKSIHQADSFTTDGKFLVADVGKKYAVVGNGIRNRLGIDIGNPLVSISIFMPKQDINLLDPSAVKSKHLIPAGVVQAGQEIDYQYIFTDLETVQELLGVETGTVSAIDIKCKSGVRPVVVGDELETILGKQFLVKDRSEQDEAFHRITKIEKWLSFVILTFMLILVSFNLLGALWMIVLEKKSDIAILHAIGMTPASLRRIFYQLGVFIGILGWSVGIVLALVLFFIQKEYGIIQLQGLMVSSYPISMRWSDLLTIAGIVLLICFLASLLPARLSVRLPKQLGENS